MVRSSKGTASRITDVSESVIREMTRKADKFGAVNLSQGYPGYDPPRGVLEAAREALSSWDRNQYSITWGWKGLREEISRSFVEDRGVYPDPEREVTVTCGTSEAIISTILGLVDPGDEVLVFQPFYENYIPAIRFAGGIPVISEIGKDMKIDMEDLENKINHKTKMLLLNTPHNPSGKVFHKKDIRTLWELCRDNDTYILCDEIYEKIVYDGEHFSPLQIKEARGNTIVVSGISKTYSLTGWRVGYVVAEEEITRAIRKVHDYVTVCAPTPFQIAAVAALGTKKEYYQDMVNYYRRSRDFMYGALKEIGLDPILPQGAYYMITYFDREDMDDIRFAERLVKDIGVAVVPGSSFYSYGGKNMIRFSFSPPMEELEEAVKRMRKGSGTLF